MGRLDFDAMCTVRFDWNGHVSKGRVAMAGFSFAYIKKMDNQNRLGGGGVAIGNCSDVCVGGPPNGCGRLGLSGKCGEKVCGVSRDFPML